MSRFGRRTKTLYGIGAKRGTLHRYTVVRWTVGILATIAVALLPATGTLKLDLWGGNHRWLGEEVGLVEAAKAFAFPFLAVNVLIIVTSNFLGRWLCGFVCPIGNLNRVSEWIDWHLRKSKSRWLGWLTLLLLCGLLAAITFAFWVDWRVFTEGSVGAQIVAWTFLLGLTGVLFGTVRGLGMKFCRNYCPSGVYFALLGPNSATGIEFANPDACTDCHACEAVCPVDLKPRELDGDERPGVGFYPDGLTNLANCLRCGDCVVACEATTADDTHEPTPLRLGVLPVELRRPHGDDGEGER